VKAIISTLKTTEFKTKAVTKEAVDTDLAVSTLLPLKEWSVDSNLQE